MKSSNAMQDIVTTAIAPLLWGTTYLVTSQWLPPGLPMTSAMLRVLPIGLIFLLYSRTFPKGDWWWKALLLGVLNIGFFQAMLFVAAYRLPGGVAATVGAVQPLVVLVLAMPLLGERPKALAIAAALAGMAGVAMLVLTPAARLDSVGLMAALAGTLSMALGTLLLKRWKAPVGALTLTAWQLVGGGLLLLPIALYKESWPAQLSLNNVLGYAWLGLIGAGLGYTLWLRGITRLPATLVTPLALLSPVSATVLGFAVLGERFTPLQVGGVLLVLAAVWVSQLARR
ncbi:EamA family transporter [Chitinimonas sp.]|uniref:EamA family transporter n=1 Tax=Chitinimonas sp. TaxID=1934313 RepID=UPI002F94119C